MRTGNLLLAISLLCISASVRSQSITPDSSFGTNGILNIPVNYDYIYFKRPVAQSSGNILVPYTASDDFGYQNQTTIARSTPNGTLDSTFGTNGKRTFNSSSTTIADVAVQPNDRILVLSSGYNRGTDFTTLYLERALPDGGIDSSFARTGRITLSGNPGTLAAVFLALKPDGHIIINYFRGKVQYCTQLNSNGSVDKSFGIKGSIVINPVQNLYPAGLIALPDNRFVLAGDYRSGSVAYSSLFFYTASGQPDVTVGNNGMVVINRRNGSGIQKNIDLHFYNHKLYVYTAADNQDELLRYNENGIPDASFGSGGKVFTQAPNSVYINRELDIQPDGKIIVVLTGTGGYKRYNTDGSADTTFGAGGTFTPGDESAGVDFSISNGRLFISSLRFNSGFRADAHLSAFSLEPASSSGKTSFIAAAVKAEIRTSASVYPNPVANVLNIAGLAANTLHRLVLVSQDGKTVAAASTRNAVYQMPMGNMAKGVYYLRIVDDNSGVSTLFKIVKP